MLDGAGVEDKPSLADLAALDAPALDRTLAGFQSAFTWWRRSSAVTVAAVAGHAVGGLSARSRLRPDRVRRGRAVRDA